MSLFCEVGGDDTAWWWYPPSHEEPLATKRSRKCCSCDHKIDVGDTARKVPRYRPPTLFEDKHGIAGDEVPLADWYLCETCGDLADSISEAGLCYRLGRDSLRDQIAEHRREEAARTVTTSTQQTGEQLHPNAG
jgi:hypothetical protein